MAPDINGASARAERRRAFVAIDAAGNLHRRIGSGTLYFKEKVDTMIFSVRARKAPRRTVVKHGRSLSVRRQDTRRRIGGISALVRISWPIINLRVGEGIPVFVKNFDGDDIAPVRLFAASELVIAGDFESRRSSLRGKGTEMEDPEDSYG